MWDGTALLKFVSSGTFWQVLELWPFCCLVFTNVSRIQYLSQICMAHNLVLSKHILCCFGWNAFIDQLLTWSPNVFMVARQFEIVVIDRIYVVRVQLHPCQSNSLYKHRLTPIQKWFQICLFRLLYSKAAILKCHAPMNDGWLTDPWFSHFAPGLLDDWLDDENYHLLDVLSNWSQLLENWKSYYVHRLM